MRRQRCDTNTNAARRVYIVLKHRDDLYVLPHSTSFFQLFISNAHSSQRSQHTDTYVTRSSRSNLKLNEIQLIFTFHTDQKSHRTSQNARSRTLFHTKIIKREIVAYSHFRILFRKLLIVSNFVPKKKDSVTPRSPVQLVWKREYFQFYTLRNGFDF